MRPLRGLQETRVATREESGVLGFPSPEEEKLHRDVFLPSVDNMKLPESEHRGPGRGPHGRPGG